MIMGKNSWPLRLVYTMTLSFSDLFGHICQRLWASLDKERDLVTGEKWCL